MGISFHGTNLLLLLVPVAIFALSFLFKGKIRWALMTFAAVVLITGPMFKLTTPTPQVRHQLDKDAFNRHLDMPEKIIVEEVPFDEKMRAKELQLEKEGESRMGQFKEDM